MTNPLKRINPIAALNWLALGLNVGFALMNLAILFAGGGPITFLCFALNAVFAVLTFKVVTRGPRLIR